MNTLQFVYNYKDHESLRSSFFELAKDRFELELGRWYEGAAGRISMFLILMQRETGSWRMSR